MTFEEAGIRFAQMQAQYRSGMLSPAQFQQTAAELRVQDQSGRWWQIEPNSAQWMMWDGTRWAFPPQAQPAPMAFAPQPAPAMYAPQPTPAAYAPQPAQTMYAPRPQVAPAPVPQASLTVPAKKVTPAIWEGLAPVVPGLAIGLAQNWTAYSKDTGMLVGFAVPSLLPAILVPLVPYIGRVVALILVLACLVWLSWPLLSQINAILGNSKAIQSHMGRGLVGVSLLYLLPRIWRIK